MTKFTREQSRQIDQAVKETIVKRLTYLEALYYIKATLGYSIIAKTYFTKKAKLKQDAASWFDRLQKKDYEYLSLYRDRYDELIALKREAWKLFEDNNNNQPLIKLKALNTLTTITVHLTNMIQLFPDIGGVSSKSSGHNSTYSEKSLEDSDPGSKYIA
jgi:hypothetical protein